MFRFFPQLEVFKARLNKQTSIKIVTRHPKFMEDTAKVTVNCEKMVVGSMLFKDLKSILAKD
jgi:hypothetical protein